VLFRSVRSYTLLNTGQYDLTTDIVLNGKTCTKLNYCCQDNDTGLMWNVSSSTDVGPASDGKLPWTTNGSGEGAFTFAAAANIANLAGYADWRIPNLFEMITIFRYEAGLIGPDSGYFGDINNNPVWTSTTNPSSTTAGLYISIATSLVTSLTKTNATTCKIALVRG
jgi:hypothetical protein